jgi:hypothetical protein
MKNYIKILVDKILLKCTEVVSWFNTPFETTNGAMLLFYLILTLDVIYSATLSSTKGCF